MKTRKNLRNGALVAVLLVVATLVMGCSNSADGDSGSGGGGASGGSGGTVALPANLKNTIWHNSGDYIKFEESTIKEITGTTSIEVEVPDFADGTYTNFGVFAATENGKIVVKFGDEEMWKFNELKTFCDSYSISGDKLTLYGGRYDRSDRNVGLTYTKVN